MVQLSRSCVSGRQCSWSAAARWGLTQCISVSVLLHCYVDAMLVGFGGGPSVGQTGNAILDLGEVSRTPQQFWQELLLGKGLVTVLLALIGLPCY